MFWGKLRLKEELGKLVDEYDEARIDDAAYRLRVGNEVYVSPTGTPDDPLNKPKKSLRKDEGFTIPAGQFGFILTEERVRVPGDAIAFISMRAKYKFRGLVNVSGFHVDPNFYGKLIFSVFNAGPGPVHLSRGEPCFLIWFADLSGAPEKCPVKPGYDNIPSELTGPIAQGVESYAGLNSKIDETNRNLSEKIATLEREQAVLKWATALAVGALITVGLRTCTFSRDNASLSHQATIPAPAATAPPNQ
jgi:dCTP deaminase